MRAIDADILKLAIVRNLYGCNQYNLVQQLIDAQPTVDPVKHGHWIRHLAIGWSEGHYTCSCCGYYLHFDRRENANYCPKCGARLDEEEQYYKY